VLGALSGAVGNFAALAAIRAIARIGDDSAGQLFLFDGVALSLRAIRLPKDPGCSGCGGASR
jgi:adenylyltransferase/sulfurtransferase